MTTLRKNEPAIPDTRELLATLFSEFKKLNGKLDVIVDANERMLRMQDELHQRIIAKNEGYKKEAKLEPDTVALLSLPAALRKTAMVLYRIDEATADDLARETKRLRAVESASANQLVRMGYLRKKREGRKVLFYIE